MRKNREDMIVNINISSDKNRSHLIVFTLFLIIISLLAINITDKIIFINEPISVPYLSPIKIPLESFFIITPIFIVMFHLNFLYNLYHHKNRIMYGYQNFEIKYQEIIPSIFNFFYILIACKMSSLVKSISLLIFCPFTLIDYSKSLLLKKWQSVDSVLKKAERNSFF